MPFGRSFHVVYHFPQAWTSKKSIKKTKPQYLVRYTHRSTLWHSPLEMCEYCTLLWLNVYYAVNLYRFTFSFHVPILPHTSAVHPVVTVLVQMKSDEMCFLKGISPKNENSVNNYSFSCHSKPIIFFHLWNTNLTSFCPSLKVHVTKTLML